MSEFDPQELLGKREDGHLEFKDAEVIRRPVKVAREVVGFLNADGGVVWIGVKEGEQGRAVELQKLENPEGARRSILDHLVGVIEPAFTQDEVGVTRVGEMIRVTVRKGAHPPYAVRDGGRHFLTRVDDRLNEMTREQLRDAFAKDRTEIGHDLSVIKAKLRERLSTEALKSDQLWLALVPTKTFSIDFADESTKQLIRTWFAEPNASGNQHGGWNFVNDLRWPRFMVGLVQHGEGTDLIKTTISEHGEVTFVGGLAILANNASPLKNRILSYALLEYPVSVFRLMGKLLEQFCPKDSDFKVLAAFSMKGIAGWTLSPGIPARAG
jgi:hypothetical protein